MGLLYFLHMLVSMFVVRQETFPNCCTGNLGGNRINQFIEEPGNSGPKGFEMRVVIIGSGASVPDADRSSSSQVIVVGNEPLLFDCGPGTGINLMRAGINPTAISRIFLTHLHMDHSLEFPSIVFCSYVLGKKDKVDLYGPLGTVDFCKLLFEKVYPYAPEVIRRIRKKGLEVVPHETAGGLVCQTNNYQVLSAPAEHGFPDIAFRIESKEGIVAISGDTRPSRSLIELARGADLLIHECSVPDDMAEFCGTPTIPYPQKLERWQSRRV